MTRFQLIFTGILIALGVGGAIVFAVAKNNSSNQNAVPTVMWGTLPSNAVQPFLAKVESDNRSTLSVTYVEKDPASFESDLIAALASGTGPDMIFLPQDLILKQLDKFYAVPFSTYSERTFLDTFIPEGDLYIRSGGIVGLPFSIDPMVMYWNRDMFTNAGVASPPSSWTTFFDLAPKMTVKDANGNITQSAIAFGEARNVTHFKDIVALLSMQAGTPIVAANQQGRLSSYLASSASGGLVPAEEALSYYTEFSNPLKASYSWNRALPTDKEDFIAGRLAVYFGYASEIGSIRAANPNLNFDVAMVPQTGDKKATFGNMNAIALLKSSKNLAAAYEAALVLTSQPVEAEWTSETGLPPVRRDMLSSVPGDAVSAISYKSSLISDAWLDPDRERTTSIFGTMVENVTSGNLLTSAAVGAASQQIDALLAQHNDSAR